MMKNQAELIERLRKTLGLEKYFTDRDILEYTKGSFLRQRTELGVALSQLWKEICKVFGFNPVVILLLFLVLSCAGPSMTGDPWQGLTPETYADKVMDNPDPEKIAEQEADEVVSDVLKEVPGLVMRALFWGVF